MLLNIAFVYFVYSGIYSFPCNTIIDEKGLISGGNSVLILDFLSG